MTEIRPFLVNGQWRTGEGTFEVSQPVRRQRWSPSSACRPKPTSRRRSRPPHETFEESSKLSVAARAAALDHISRRLDETKEENAELIAREGGKPLKWARVEAARAVSTFRWASETLRHGQDEAMRLDTEAAFGSRFGILRRFPIGPGARHHAVQLPA